MTGKMFVLLTAVILTHVGIGFWAILHSGDELARGLLGIPSIFVAGIETAFLIIATSQRARDRNADRR